MKISSQIIKFKLGILIGIICCILAPALYDLTLPSEASLIEAYNKELNLIDIDNIKGLHREGERIIKGKNYGIRYTYLQGENKYIVKTICEKFIENGWTLSEKWASDQEIYYSLEKDDFFVRLDADDVILSVNIETKGLYRKIS